MPVWGDFQADTSLMGIETGIGRDFEGRPVRPDEWATVRRLRLAMLEAEPHAYDADPDRERGAPESFWRDWAQSQGEYERTVTWVVSLDGSVVAMGVVSRVAVDARIDPVAASRAEAWAAHVWGMWVEPPARGRSIASALLAAIEEWAARTGAAYVELGVIEGNDAARARYEFLGYRDSGTVIVTGTGRPAPVLVKALNRGLVAGLSA